MTLRLVLMLVIQLTIPNSNSCIFVYKALKGLNCCLLQLSSHCLKGLTLQKYEDLTTCTTPTPCRGFKHRSPGYRTKLTPMVQSRQKTCDYPNPGQTKSTGRYKIKTK